MTATAHSGRGRARAAGSRATAAALRAALRLPPATTPDVEVRRGLRVPMADGVTLVADLYRPRGAGPLPTVLVRSPYGRAGAYSLLNARLLAERGLQVLLQSTRGSFGSGGEFDPFLEREDGLATLAWIREQPWYAGALGTTGLSYLGLVQWAVADAPDLAAMTPTVTASEFRSQTYPGGTFSLDTALAWVQLVELQERPLGLLRHVLRLPRLRRAMNHLPLADADRALLGYHVPYYQAWLEHHAPGDAYWAERSYDDRVDDVRGVVAMVSGWYDIFLPWQVRDFERLRAAGRDAQLTIGPWAHTSPGLLATAARVAIRTLCGALAGDRRGEPGAPVRVYVTGAKQWRELPSWPPPDAASQRWRLQPGRGLAPGAPPSGSEPDRYRYDPADPTPALSGPVLVGRATPVDNAPLETRPDVLTYTSAALERPLEIGGPVSAEIHLQSSRAHTDVFVRLCDVDRRGISRNVCDGIRRVGPGDPDAAADGTVRVDVELWPAAHRFGRGHRLRVQVSSGAHPRFARNPGSGEPLGRATTLLAADQAVCHDAARPSAIILPVRG